MNQCHNFFASSSDFGWQDFVVVMPHWNKMWMRLRNAVAATGTNFVASNGTKWTPSPIQSHTKNACFPFVHRSTISDVFPCGHMMTSRSEMRRNVISIFGTPKVGKMWMSHGKICKLAFFDIAWTDGNCAKTNTASSAPHKIFHGHGERVCATLAAFTDMIPQAWDAGTKFHIT